MIGEPTTGYDFSFKVETPIAIGRDALETIPDIFNSQHIHHPFWIIPSEIVQQRAIKRILNRVYAMNSDMMVSSITVISPSFTEAQLEQIADTIRQGEHDCVVVCGDSETIHKGKLTTLMAMRPSVEVPVPIQKFLQEGGAASTIPLIVIPCGESDGSEFSGDVRYNQRIYRVPQTIPVYAIGDGRLSKCTTPKSVARSLCIALMNMGTALLTDDNPMMRATAESVLFYAHETLECLLGPGLTGLRWMDCTLSATAAIHAAGLCAQNRGDSIIMEFSERLAIEGLADHYQSAAALLPFVFKLIHGLNKQLYGEMESMLQGMDPIEFSKAWVALTEPKETDRILQQLCGDMHDLLIHPKHIRALEPLLSLFPVEGRWR